MISDLVQGNENIFCSLLSQVVLSYNCSLKPDTLINFVYDNVNALQKADLKYQQVCSQKCTTNVKSQVIEEQATKIETLTRQLDSVEKSGDN